jgi:hypothetical protein
LNRGVARTHSKGKSAGTFEGECSTHEWKLRAAGIRDTRFMQQKCGVAQYRKTSGTLASMRQKDFETSFDADFSFRDG